MSDLGVINSRAMVALTDYDWYFTLMGLQSVDTVNFWTPTPWNVRGLTKGDKVYFLLKEKYGRNICGYGDFSYYENISVEEAWNKHGIYNGVENLAKLQLRVATYTDKNSEKGYTGQGHIIGCIILSDVVFFDQMEQVSPMDYGWDIPKQVVKYKYFDQQYISAKAEQPMEDIIPFTLLTNDDTKQFKERKSKDRKGQPQFRRKILKAYNNICCVTGEKTLDLLQAAHIQNHISEASNHVQNGILFRIDFHALFDAGLMTIDDQFIIRISANLSSSYYQNFDGKTITLPEKNKRPSIDALRWHNKYMFRK